MCTNQIWEGALTSVTKHYAQHLGPLYTWMGGDLQTAMERKRVELQALGLCELEHNTKNNSIRAK